MKRTVWRDFSPRTDTYVGRCSHCGRYQKKKGFLKVHCFLMAFIAFRVYRTFCMIIVEIWRK